MNTKLTALLIGVIAACGFAVLALSKQAADTPARAAPAAAVGEADRAGAAVSVPEQLAAERPETEVVLGLEVLKDRNCTVELHYVDLGNGTVTEAYRCVPVSPATDDYDHYSDEQLRILSYSDAKAASVLGKRLVSVDPARAEALLLRAVALQPGNLDPVMWLAAQAHSLRGKSPAAQQARANTYVLTRTAQALGSKADIRWILRDLQQAGFSLEDVARLDRQVRANLRRMRNIQLEVFGESTIDEVQL